MFSFFVLAVMLSVLGLVLVLFDVDPVKVVASVGMCAIVAALLSIVLSIQENRKRDNH